jgi:endonuclease-3 related protein
MSDSYPEKKIAEIYSRLFRAWGRQHWWPGQSRFEVIVGTYLTQNTSWTNVELAMKELRSAKVLTVEGIRAVPIRRLEKLIRSSGYFRQKAGRLKRFVKFLDENYGGSLTRMFAQPTNKLREQLLALNGIGRETADSILLYAGQHPVFVIDAYTRRMATRHEIAGEKATYEELRGLFERGLGNVAVEAPDEVVPELIIGPKGTSHAPSRMSLARRVPLAQVFNEMHGLIVGVGKNYCSKSKPRCDECPLKHLLPSGTRTAAADLSLKA